jgi:phosphoribosyl 1,2-cyclic phosphate phosphodiesterase
MSTVVSTAAPSPSRLTVHGRQTYNPPVATRTFEFLGTGTSVGIPMVGCACAVCTSADPRNNRYRCAVLIRTPRGNILVDTPPELRLQLLRAKVSYVGAVLFTHYHADHLMGLDDLRPMPRHLGSAVPLFCTTEVERKIRTVFSYAFTPDADSLPSGYLPKLVFRTIGSGPFEALGETVTPIPLNHAWFDVLGFRIGDVAYCTDVNKIPKESWPLLEGVRVLVLDALRYKPHPGHFCLEEAVEVVQRLRPEQAYFTHMSHDLDHETVNRQLPKGMELAYDGLTFEF